MGIFALIPGIQIIGAALMCVPSRGNIPLAADAAEILLEPSTSAELRRAVPAPLHAYLDRLKAAGSSSISTPPSSARMIVPGSGWTDATLSGQDPGFTTREREILFLVSRGLSTKRIAQTLRISPETAKWHTRNVYEKLGVHDRPSAQLAIRRLQLADGGGPGQC